MTRKDLPLFAIFMEAISQEAVWIEYCVDNCEESASVYVLADLGLVVKSDCAFRLTAKGYAFYQEALVQLSDEAGYNEEEANKDPAAQELCSIMSDAFDKMMREEL